MFREDIPHVAVWIAASPLWQRYHLDAAKASRQLDRAVTHGDLLIAAATPDDKICGLAWCLINGAFGRSMYLRLLGVDGAYRGGGVGALLLDEAERRAAALSQDMVLLVSDFNTSAQRFYQRQGYTQVGALPGYVLSDVTELIFWKPLPAVSQTIVRSEKEAQPIDNEGPQEHTP